MGGRSGSPGCEPSVVVRGQQNHRHPIVHGLDQLIGIGGDDRLRLKHVAGRTVLPTVPDACECEDFAVRKLNRPGLLGSVSDFLPLVKTL
jgi:hypothetical protein